MNDIDALIVKLKAANIKLQEQVEDLQQEILEYREYAADDRDLIQKYERMLNISKNCRHPYNGNMCINAKPGDKCPDCGMNGYND